MGGKWKHVYFDVKILKFMHVKSPQKGHGKLYYEKTCANFIFFTKINSLSNLIFP